MGRVTPRVRRELNNGTYFESQARSIPVVGTPGAPGMGVPIGGAFGQSLVKKSGDNFDTEWGAPVRYTTVTSATFVISASNLIFGMNFFGVNYPGSVTITLPASVAPEQLIVIKDESGAADSNNILIKTI